MSILPARTTAVLRHAAQGRVGRVGFGEYTCAGRPLAYMLYAHLRGLGLWEPRAVAGVGVKVCLTDDGYAAIGYDVEVDHGLHSTATGRIVKARPERITMAQRIGLAKVARRQWRPDRRLNLIDHGWVVGCSQDASIPAGWFRLTERGWRALGYDLDVEARTR